MRISEKNLLRIFIAALVIMVVLGIATFGWLMSSQNANLINKRIDESMIRLVDYNHSEPNEIACAALSPECGACFGEIIDKECYMTQEQFERYKQRFPDLRGEPARP